MNGVRIFVLSDLWMPFPGGAERLMFNIARDLERRGATVGVMTGYELAKQYDGPPVLIDDDIGVHEQQPVGAAKVTAAIEKFDPDIILTHHLYARQFEDEIYKTGVPVVQVVLNGTRMPGAALAVFISEWVRERAAGYEIDLVMTPPAGADTVADGHEHAVGFIKPIEHKGVRFFYRIAKSMPERRFVVLRGEWQELEVIEQLPNVEFMEPVEDIRDFWRRVDCVLVPSVSEDAGTVGQEAAANRVPCLSSQAGGLPETNGGGILLSTNRVGRWVRAIRQLDDPDQYKQVVDRQAAYLHLTDHAGKLDKLAGRMEAIARGFASRR